MTAQSEFHNLLANRFVNEIIGPAIKSGATDTELVVVLESAQVSVLEILHRHYGLTPQLATSLVEESLGRAIERFAGNRRAA